jgi:glycosyltransferase involved in cell wall biosynthesis
MACERHGMEAPRTRNSVHDDTHAVVTEPNSLVIDTEGKSNEYKDFFVTTEPSRICGSRAVSQEDRKAEVEGTRLNRTRGLEVTYEGPMLSHSGYSTMNRAVVDGMARAGVRVKTSIVTTPVDIPEKTANKFREMEWVSVRDDSPKVHGLTVPQNMGHKGRRILYTMMETSDGVHQDYVGKLNMMNEVWVPNRYLVDILVKSGVHADIYEMPLGVDTSLYKPGVKPMHLHHDTKGFVFLSVFNWGFRKGWDILLKAYLEEFSSDEDVSLVMSVKSFGNPKGIADIVSQIKSFKAGIRKHESAMPHMMLHTSSVDEANMPSLYAAADAFVLFSRGEGMGLPYLEAGSCGLPVIGTRCTAQGVFLNDDNSYLVDPDGYTRHQITDPAFGNMARLCRFYEGQLFPKFGSTAMGRAKDCMREVFEGLGEAKKKGEQLRRDICDNLTWNHAINRITSRLEEIC